MSTISKTASDKALVSLIKDRISVQLSESESRVVPVYRKGERPNTDSPEEFIEVHNNGIIQAITKPLGIYKGNIAIAVYCQAYPDETIKFNRVESLLGQIEDLVNCKTGNNIYFEVDNANLITPTTYDAESGYSITVLNVEWHTTV
jgi:hypothetical protein